MSSRVDDPPLSLFQFYCLTDINDKTLQRWAAEGFFGEQVMRGKWSTSSLIKGVIQQMELKAMQRAESDPMKQAKIRGLEANAARAELQVAKAAGELVSAAETREVMTEMILTFNKKIGAIPDRLSAQLVGLTQDEISKLLKKELDFALRTLADSPLK